MKPICNFCKNQENSVVWEGKVQCGAAKYRTTSDGYGPFKDGAVCVHDADLSDKFESRKEGEGPIVRMSKLLADQEKEISAMRDEIFTLKERLTKI